MAIASNLGFPRIGAQRELKKAVEAFWKEKITEEELLKEAANLRKYHWQLQQEAGIAHIPSNDFSPYDQMLDMIATLGAIPPRYNFSDEKVGTATYFAMARGSQHDGQDVTAMEMTKWFDTNYHYIVPEFTVDQRFSLRSTKAVDEFNEAKALGITTRPVLIGPVTFLLLGKLHGSDASPLSLLSSLLPVYQELLAQLRDAGAEWVQIDEPCLVTDLSGEAKQAYKDAYTALAEVEGINLLLATYFGDLRDNLQTAFSLPVKGVHVDLVRGRDQLKAVLGAVQENQHLSLGLVNGRNIWKTDLEQALTLAEQATSVLGAERVLVAPSCSLLHSPVDLDQEEKLDAELKNWLAFAKQKLHEIARLTTALNGQKDESAFAANKEALISRAQSSLIHNHAVKDRVSSITPEMTERQNPFAERIATQAEALKLPLLPTTTIGSFPQTQDVRQARARFKKGELSREEYDAFLKTKTEEVIRTQEDIGLDVLVHGEFERNDMVEYFGEKLEGFAFTQHGWVQSYGSRGVKPPIIFGDISRPEPMTVRWSSYAQSLTDKWVKGMLTGPVTILQWSFVRDDQPREDTARQIALAIRDEVVDLEKAGIHVIQIDEPAFREGLPLRKADREAYLNWAVESFRISASGVQDATQIHTHMCYSEFNDIIESIAALDADVISIETSRSQMELLDAFVDFHYPNEIGPGVYDIHSPRVPAANEMEALLNKALKVLRPEQVWVNPDCGLKTRGWEETEAALKEMVTAATTTRKAFAEDSQAVG